MSQEFEISVEPILKQIFVYVHSHVLTLGLNIALATMLETSSPCDLQASWYRELGVRASGYRELAV